MTGDMTVGNPGKKLLYFAVPMVLGNIFQQLYNIVDSMIVGNYVGADALAAVGASTSITFLFIAAATGASVGASVVISQLFGAAQYGKMKSAVYTALISIFAVSAVLMGIGIAANKTILRLMNTPDNIFQDASVYLQIYFFGIIFLFMYNTLTAVFNALGLSRIPLMFLFLSSVINVVLDLVFVLNFHMGVAGVAYATLIAQGISAVLSYITLLRRMNKMEIEEPYSYFDKEILKNISKVAVPSTIQQSIVSIGIIMVQALVNQYGGVVIAGYTAATKIDSIAINPMVNIGSALSTFTAQNIGAGKPERISKGLRAAGSMVLVMGFIITGTIFLFGESLVSSFMETSANLDVIAVGVEYLKVVSLFYVVFGAMNLMNGILRGAGDLKVFMLCTLTNLLTRVCLAYLLSAVISYNAIWWAIPIGWTAGLLVACVRYISGRWKQFSLVKEEPETEGEKPPKT